MKHLHSFLLLLLCLFFFYCGGNTGGATPTSDCKIEGTIEGITTSHVRLFGFLGENNYFIDSFPANNGQFTITTDSLYPGGIYYFVSGNDVVTLFFDADQHFSFSGKSGDLLNTLEFKGSKVNELFYKNLRFEEDYQARLDPIVNELNAPSISEDKKAELEAERDALIDEREAHLQWFYDNHPNSLFTIYKKAGQNPKLRDITNPDGTPDEAAQVYFYRHDFWNNVDFADERLLRTPVIKNKLERYITKLTPQQADSMIAAVDPLIQKSKANKEMFKFVSNYIGMHFQKPKFMGDDAVYVHIVQNYFTYDQAFWADTTDIDALQRDAAWKKPSLIGQPGQDITATDINGNNVSLFDIQAPYIIIYIFNPDCENCKKETPKLVAAYHNELKQKGAEVFTICDCDDEQLWKNYVNTTGMSIWTNVSDPTFQSQFHRKYHFSTTPGIYVLNEDRTIIGKNINSEQIGVIIDRDMEKR